MPLPIWTPGTLYNPGATVRRASAPPVEVQTIQNPSFEDGSGTNQPGWDLGFSTTTNTVIHFDGAKCLQVAQAPTATPDEQNDPNSQSGGTRTFSTDLKPVSPGQSITADLYVAHIDTNSIGGSPLFGRGGRLELDWLRADETFISRSASAIVYATAGGWRLATVTGTAPAGAALVRVSIWAFRNSGNESIFFDHFTWNHSTAAEGSGLVFTAVQPDAGFSGAVEPVWPTVNGVQVIDNEVVWEAINGSRVVWEANPILFSDYYEPDWPLSVGSSIVDNTIIWTAISRRVEDARCPNSAIVAIATSKVFSGDDDIVGFSATVNPLGWDPNVFPDDAGYLPFGLQTFGAMPVSAMGIYRGSLAVFNSQGYQIWQVGEDPADHALLDSGPIGCRWPRTPLAVMNDLVFLSAVGVRNLQIAGASTNLQVGNFGQAIDTLVLEKLRDDNPYSNSDDPFSLYIPAFGQYWLFFGDEAFVLTINGIKQLSWSRYVFPEAITDWTLEDDDLLLRTANNRVWRVSVDALYDDTRINDYEGGDNVPFGGIIQWLHLDLGSIGVEKQFVGFDLVATAPEGVSVSIGYDQRDLNARTDDYDMDADSLPGKLVPIPVSGPSFDLRLTFEPGQQWEWQAACLYVSDLRTGS